MKNTPEENTAPCGLICNECSLFLVPYDQEAAKEILAWFKKENWYENDQNIEDLLKNEDYCEGCRSSRERLHWSPNCKILKCCVDKKELKFCCECPEFPCEIYEEWVVEGKNHQKAFDKLQQMK